MRSVLLAQLRASAARLVATTLAIVLAVAFVVATLVLGQTSRTTTLRAVGGQYAGVDAVVTSGTGVRLPVAAEVARVPGVRAVDPLVSTGTQALLPDRRATQYVQVDSVATDSALRWQRLAAGALPTRAGEIALGTGSGARVGDAVPVTGYGNGPPTVMPVTVVGLVDLRGDPSAASSARAFATYDQVHAWGGGDATELRVAGTSGTDRTALVAWLRRALGGPELTVRTGGQAAAAQVARFTGGTDVLTAVLLVFASVAVLVAGLVIANTFAVLLAQRTRELALLRCVGATARQVRRGVLGEAAVSGAVASALGVLTGIGLAGVVSIVAGASSPVPLSGVVVPWYAVGLGLGVGTVVTLLAALGPARAATRVSPLAALRPVDPAPLRSRPGRLRLVLGLLLLGPGAALLALGATQAQLLVALAGGVLSALGVLLLAQRAIPPVVALAGRLAGRVGGVPARLAAGNAVRQPRRTAATATALVIGVTLTTAMLVGGASTRATATSGLTAAYPTDVVISPGGEPCRRPCSPGCSPCTAWPPASACGPPRSPARTSSRFASKR